MKTDKFSTSQKPKKQPKNTKITTKTPFFRSYAGVRSLCSFYLFSTKKHPFQSAFLFYGFKTAIQLHQHMLVQAVDKLAALAVVVDSSVAAVAVDKPVVAVQAVEPVELAEFAD